MLASAPRELGLEGNTSVLISARTLDVGSGISRT